MCFPPLIFEPFFFVSFPCLPDELLFCYIEENNESVILTFRNEIQFSMADNPILMVTLYVFVGVHVCTYVCHCRFKQVNMYIQAFYVGMRVYQILEDVLSFIYEYLCK